jgi:hypothetical protein
MIDSEEIRPLEKGGYRDLHLLENSAGHGFAGNQDDIPTGQNLFQVRLKGSANQALDPVSLDRVAQASPGDDPKPGMIFEIGRGDQHQKRVGMGSSRTPHPLEVGGSCQAQTSFHPNAQTTQTRCVWKIDGSTVPIDLLDVIVHGDGEATATTRPAVLQYFSSVSSRHAQAKTMHADAAANLGLISSFYHSAYLLFQ